MKKEQFEVIFGILVCLVLTSCIERQYNGKANLQQTTTNDVGTANSYIERYELASKGKIKANSEIPIYCRLQSQVVKLKIYEGVKVKKGDVLLVLNDEDIQAEIIKSYCALEQAKFQLEEILIGQGYKKANFKNIPIEVVALAKIKSGFNIAEHNYKVSQNQLSKTIIKAPATGIITEVNIKQYDYPIMGNPVFKIIDNEKLKVVFFTLESEINKIKMGSYVKVSTVAYPTEKHKAIVHRISPIVDKNGMIYIEAQLKSHTNLLPGMTAIINI